MGLFSKPSGKKKTPTNAPSPLSAKQRALQEQEAKVKADIEKNERLVQNAPIIAAEQKRRQREEMINRASMTHRPTRPTAVVDRGTTLRADMPATGQQRRTRAERRQGRLMFFVLLLTLAAAIFYLYHTVTHG